MATVSFSFVAKFPAKKVKDSFTNPAFAKLHTASKFFAKAGIIKEDKNTIIRTVAIGADKAALPVIAIITFADADAGKATKVDAVIANVPDAKAADVKALAKIINADITTFLTPKPKAVKAPAKKAAKATAKKAGAPKKAAADKKPAAAKKVAAKKPAAAKKTAAKKPAAKKAAKPADTAPATTAPKA